MVIVIRVIKRSIKHFLPKNATKMATYIVENRNFIELIGPSGVGKSTLFKKLAIELNGGFNTRTDIDRHKPIGILSELIRPAHDVLLQTKLVNLTKRDYNAYINADLMRYFCGIISEDIAMGAIANERGFLLEEGLFHNFSKELVALEEVELKAITKGRIIVYLRPKAPQTVVERIRKRQQEGGHVVAHHIGKTNEELLTLAENSTIDFDLLIQRLEAIGVPVFQITAEAPVEINELLYFLRENKTIVRSE